MNVRRIVLMTAMAASLIGCGSDGDGDVVLASSPISAAAGGTVSSPSGDFKLTVPAGALDKDTGVVIRRLDGTPTLSSTLQSNSSQYSVSFVPSAVLSTAMTVEIKSTAAPQHPDLGEIAELPAGGTWARLPANFFRVSNNVTVGQTKTPGTFVAVKRRLQADTGAAVARGRTAFLGETFGNEAFFGDVLGLHTLLNGLTPAQAVGAGVQVDLAKVPSAIVTVLTGADLAAKDAALQNPAVTRALIKAGAVVGVKGVYADASSDTLTSAGITCALCHVNVKPTTFTLSSGATPLPIGPLSVDGIPNSAMNAGAILSLTPFAQGSAPTVALLQGWGAGRFDIRALPDNPLDDGVDNPTRIPPLWNFVDLEEQGFAYDFDGLFKSTSIPNNSLASQAEAVYDLVMHANGAFGTSTGSVPPTLSITPPQSLLDALTAAETAAPGNVITAATLLDVQAFQRSIISPAPGAYVEALALQGFELFNGKARCSGCHRTAEFTGPVISTHITVTPPTGGLAAGIKTPGLRGLSTHAPYFHDGSAATLRAVVDTYAGRVTPALSEDEKTALVEYLKTL